MKTMYPVDRRKIAAHMYALLMSLRKTAKLLQVHHTTVSRWLKSPDRKAYSPRQRSKGSVHVIEVIKSALANDPFLSATKLKAIVSACAGVDVSKSHTLFTP